MPNHKFFRSFFFAGISAYKNAILKVQSEHSCPFLSLISVTKFISQNIGSEYVEQTLLKGDSRVNKSLS